MPEHNRSAMMSCIGVIFAKKLEREKFFSFCEGVLNHTQKNIIIPIMYRKCNYRNLYAIFISFISMQIVSLPEKQQEAPDILGT